MHPLLNLRCNSFLLIFHLQVTYRPVALRGKSGGRRWEKTRVDIGKGKFRRKRERKGGRRKDVGRGL